MVVLAGRAAGAQAASTGSGFAVDRFEPAGGGSDWFSLESLDFYGRGRPAFGLILDEAWKPLVIYDQSGHAVATLLRDQMIAHADAAVMLGNHFRLDVNLPVVLYQQGNALILNDQSYAVPVRTALGDVRIGADLRVFGHTGDPLVAAVGAQVFVPAGKTSSYTGDGSWRVWPRVMLAGNLRTFSWAASVGYHLRPTYKCGCTLTPGDELTAGVAAGVRVLPGVLIGPELFASTARAHFGSSVMSPLELLVGAHVQVARGWTLSAGAGPGLTDGAGSPVVRAVVGLRYFAPVEAPVVPPPPPLPPPPVRKRPPAPRPAPPPPPPPPPPPDQDRDGIVDAEDACPAEPGDKSEDPKKNGCPPPKDTDGDGIVDSEDACPADAGPRNDDPARNGCPVVRIEAGQIRIREQVKFKTASSQILKESDYILQAVVKILVDHPEIKSVRVEGHTDSRGKRGYNKKLSQRRAASVVKWLVKHGISKRRLTSAGYGQERPIATNLTDEGRHENRRVEFHIVEGPGGEKTP